MKIMVKNIAGETVSVTIHPSDTFRDLKERIQNETGVEVDFDQFLVKGKKIRDDQCVTNYFFDDDPNLYLPDELESSSMPQLECVVPGCNNTQLECPGKAFFKFPLEENRCQSWLLECRRIDLLERTDNFPSEQYAICADHFLEEQFEDATKQKLVEEAIPVVFEFEVENEHPASVTDSEGIFTADKCEVLIKEEMKAMSEKSAVGSEEEEVCNSNLGLLCRLCANSISDVVYIYSSTGVEQRIAEKINSCLPITVKITDPLPKQLCSTCITKLNLCHEFVNTCLEAQDKLLTLKQQQYFMSHSVSSSGTDYGSKNSNDFLTNVKVGDNTEWKSMNSSVESDKDNDNSKQCDTYCCPLCYEGNMTVQFEQDSKLETSDNSEDHEDEVEEGKKTTFSGIFAADRNSVLNADSSEENSNQWEDDDDVDNNPVDMADGNISPEGSQEAGDVEEVFGLPNDENIKLYDSENITLDNPSCRICGDVFKNVDLCIAHSSCHANSDIFPCSLCDLCFSSQSSFTSHCEEHRNEAKKLKPKISKRLVCHGCGRRFNTERTLKNHSCGVAPRPHKCLECGKFFRTEVRLLFHQQFHQGGNPVVCEYCGKEFSRENNLFDHVRLVHMGEKAHCCDQCGKTFQLKARLIAHQRVHTGERPFECDVCGGKFYDKATLKGHRITHLDVKPFQCEKCGRCFARKTLFKQHTLAHLCDERKRTRIYTCKICADSTFPTYAKLIEHRKEVHPEADMNEIDANTKVSKPFKCDDCGKSFAYRVTLVAHRRNHTGELPFQCEFCEKRFSQKRSLVLHRRTHTGEKPFVCKDCGKRFVQSAHLYSHQRLHTGEKPYSCEVCGESFRLKDVRDAHQRKHTGERPFKCNVCSKAFRTSHSYYQHMWIHQGKKPYPCGYCGKAFRRSNGLKIHIRIHTGEKPHACDICGRCFAQKQDMKKHRNLHVVGKL